MLKGEFGFSSAPALTCAQAL